MSWQAYVDDSLVKSGHVDHGAIISAAGDSTWAASAGFTINPEEMKALVDILSGNQAAVDKAYTERITIGGDRYIPTRIEGRSIYARLDKSGIAIAKTKQAILLGHHNETQQAGNATQTVEALADYLTNLGY